MLKYYYWDAKTLFLVKLFFFAKGKLGGGVTCVAGIKAAGRNGEKGKKR